MVLGIAVILALERRSSPASVICPYCENIVEYDENTTGSPLSTRYVVSRFPLFIMSDEAPARGSSVTGQKHAVMSSSLPFEVSAASPVEHVTSSTMGDVFRKVRLIPLTWYSAIFHSCECVIPFF